MLYILFGITLIFLIINFALTRGDYLHPSMVFCEIFAAYELICIIGQQAFQITLHIETVYVLSCGFIAFTIGGVLGSRRKSFGKVNDGASENSTYRQKYIAIPNYLVYSLIVLQVITQIYFIKYLKAIAAAYGSGGGSLGELIKLYDNMTKFWITIFSELNVTIPMAYRILNPVTNAAAWIVLYVAVNNFMINKKVKISHVIVLLMQCVGILLNGSRSPLFRIITFIIIMMYMLNYKKYQYRKGSFKNFFRLIFAAIGVTALMIALLYVMGRAENMMNIWKYIFIYTGAPIVNLDTFLQNTSIRMLGGDTTFFGEHTFYTGYAYLDKWFKFSFSGKVDSLGGFTFSSNGIEIGNVYTTYNAFAYDFGYLGVFPLIFIVALYYTKAYKRILRNNCSTKSIDMDMFIYAYLFNDLIMLAFSNRFYGTVLDAPFLKLIVVTCFFKWMIFDKKVIIGKYSLKWSD